MKEQLPIREISVHLKSICCSSRIPRINSQQSVWTVKYGWNGRSNKWPLSLNRPPKWQLFTSDSAKRVEHIDGSHWLKAHSLSNCAYFIIELTYAQFHERMRLQAMIINLGKRIFRKVKISNKIKLCKFFLDVRGFIGTVCERKNTWWCVEYSKIEKN